MKCSWVAPLLLLAACNVGASDAAKPTEKSTTAKPSQLVCVEAPRTGSNIKRRSCMSKEQADARRKEDQAAAEGLKRGSAGRSKSDTSGGAGVMGR